MEPRKRSTSSALYGRCTPFHRGLFAHSCSMHSCASACCAVRSSSLINGALERCWACFVPLLFVGICVFSCEFIGERIELRAFKRGRILRSRSSLHLSRGHGGIFLFLPHRLLQEVH